MKNKKVRIAVIDTNVDTRSSILSNIPIHFSHFVDFNSHEVGHGTAVCSIIAKECNQIDLTIFPIFHDLENGIFVEDVIDCLNCINLNDHFDIINMSLGITSLVPEDLKKLQDICNSIISKGTIIVAAFDNGGGMSYPAAFENVIGVDVSPEIKSHHEYIYVENSPINIQGSSRPQRVNWGDNKYLLANGSSFVAPFVTGRIADIILKENLSISGIKELLYRGAWKTKTFGQEVGFYHPFEINSAVAFPFNKEIHSLVAFPSLSVKITDIFDIKHAMRVNRLASEVMGFTLESDYVIQDIDSIKWDDKFDTFILGHTREISNILGIAYIKNLVNRCLSFGKKIYAFDDDIIDYCTDSTAKIFYPRVDITSVPKRNMGKLWNINTPVLAVLGTRSKQGKFTVQQYLRQKMLNIGYDVGFLSSEPSGFLLGAQEVFPYGYDSTVKVPLDDSIPIVNDMLHRIDIQGFDLIITGGQSGVLPYEYSNTRNMLLPQVSFLYGINPDAVVLCLCADDDIEYIKRTICYIESSCGTTVISAILYPFSYEATASGQYLRKSLQPDKYVSIAKSFTEKLEIPVYTHSDCDIDACVFKIIDYFAE